MAQAAENSTWLRAVRRAAAEGRLSHAVLLTGSGELLPSARYLAAAHVCEGKDKPCLHCRHCRKVMEGIHPDVILVQDAEHRELTVDAVRALRRDVYIRPNEAERKVYLMADCRQLNERDQNVLLKIVEEGPPYAAFVFCADSSAALLETLRSRCVVLRCGDGDEQPLCPAAGELCEAFGRGRLLPVVKYLTALESGKCKREELREILRDTWRAAAEALLMRRGKAQSDALCAREAALLAEKLTDRQLAGLTDMLAQYVRECDCNVGVGAVLGAIAVRWEELL